MKTKIQLSCMVLVFHFLSTYSQVTPYKYNTVKKPTSTSKALNTMSKSVKDNNAKTTFKMPKFTLPQKIRKNIIADGKIIGYNEFYGVGTGSRNDQNKISPKINKGNTFEKNDFVCQKTNLSLNANTTDIGFVSLSTPNWLLPGVIFENKKVLDANRTAFLKERKPITLSVNVNNIIESENVSNSNKLSNLRNAVNKIKGKIGNKRVSAKFIGEYKEVYTLQELELNMTGKYTGDFGLTSGSVKLSSSYKDSNEFHFYMLKFTQPLFTISVDANELVADASFFTDKSIKKSDLTYISSVTYGRIALVIVKSRLEITKFQGEVEGKLKTLFSKGSLKVGSDYLEKEKNYEVKAFFYGGDAAAAIRSFESTIENKQIDIQHYLNTDPGKPSLGLPISYTLNGMTGYNVGIKTVMNQNIQTCIPMNSGDKVKVRITLENFECVDSGDDTMITGDLKDDYGFNQWIEFTANGKKIHHTNVYMNINEKLKINDGKDRIFNGNKQYQFWVEEGKKKKIGNYIDFEISASELNDTYGKFIIRNSLMEYSDQTTSMAGGNSRVLVDIKKVVMALSDLSDPQKVPKGQWKTYGEMKLRKYANDSDDIYGYINFSKDGRKARAKMRFKLLD